MFELATNCPLAIAGAPGANESRGESKPRLQSALADLKRAEQEHVEESRAEEHARLEPAVPNAAPGECASSSQGADSEYLFRVRLSSFAELHEIARKNHETLEKMKRLIGKPASSSFPPGTELTQTDKLRELDRLVAMAKALGEVAVSAT